MSDTILILILEAAVFISCSLVLYCLFIIKGLKTTKKILDSSLEDNGKEIAYLQDVAQLGEKSGDSLASVEEAFAKYRGKTKLMMQKMKSQELEIQQLKTQLDKVNMQNAAILKQLQAAAKQSPVLADSFKMPLKEVAKQVSKEQRMVSELKDHKVRLEAKTQVLEQRLKQTIVEKDFIESRFVEFAEAEEKQAEQGPKKMSAPSRYAGRMNRTVQ